MAYPPIPQNIAGFKAFQYLGEKDFSRFRHAKKENIAIGACSKENKEEYENYWSERLFEEA